MKKHRTRDIVVLLVAIAAVVIALVVNKPDAYPEEPELELCPIDTIV